MQPGLGDALHLGALQQEAWRRRALSEMAGKASRKRCLDKDLKDV